jgi:hypothetical protein
MCWSFRRGLNFGPLRVNLSKNGVGFSVGAKGFRIGRVRLSGVLLLLHHALQAISPHLRAGQCSQVRSPRVMARWCHQIARAGDNRRLLAQVFTLLYK